MEQVVAEHQNIHEKLIRKFVDFAKEKVLEEGADYFRENARRAAIGFSKWLAAKGIAGTATAATLGYALGAASAFLVGLDLANLLLNLEGTYNAAVKAQYSTRVADQLDRVADRIRARKAGAGIRLPELRPYAAAESLRIHAHATFWIGSSEVLGANPVDDAKAWLLDRSGVENNLENRREVFYERGERFHRHATTFFRPPLLDTALAQTPNLPPTVTRTTETRPLTPGEDQTFGISFRDRTGDLSRVVWHVDGDSEPVAETRVSGGSGSHQIELDFDRRGTHTVTASVYDEGAPEARPDDASRVRWQPTVVEERDRVVAHVETTRDDPGRDPGSQATAESGVDSSDQVRASIPYQRTEDANVEVERRENSFEVQVSTSREEGGIVTLDLDLEAVGVRNPREIDVLLDGEPVEQAADFGDLVDSVEDRGPAKYLATIGSEGAQIQIAVPHFSTREIEIRKAQPGTDGPGPRDQGVPAAGPIAILMAALAAAGATARLRRPER